MARYRLRSIMLRKILLLPVLLFCCTACSVPQQYEQYSSLSLSEQGEKQCGDTRESCDFYHCRDRYKSCGSSGYYLGYGGYYCRLFSDLYEQMSPAGKEWIDCTKTCLISFIDAWIPENSDCSVVEERAFGSHPSCYVDCGFCSLPGADIRRVRNLVGGNSTFSQDMDIVVRCLAFPDPPPRQGFQNSCVAERGGCRDGVAVTLAPVELARINEECRKETGYPGPDVRPETPDCVKYVK